MIRAFEEKGFRIGCKSESFESLSDNRSEHTLHIKILQTYFQGFNQSLQ